MVLFTSHDHQFVSTVANRIVEITDNGIIDVMMDFEEYLRMKEADSDEVYEHPVMDEYIERHAA